jgi:ankyrin repeat protein
VWKLADFGLSTEASSKTNQATQYARGTPGYRAPELVVTEGDPVYNNKVDIWSMGCLLYELATGNRAFNNDWVVVEHRYERKNKEVILDNTFDDDSKKLITNFIVNMLQIEPSARASASFLSKEFRRLTEVTGRSSTDGYDGLSSSSMSTINEARRSLPTPPMSQTKQVVPNADKPIPPSGFLRQQLYRAAERGDVEAVETLLNAKVVDVNMKGCQFGTALQAAANHGHEMIVRLLLENGANVNARGGFYGNALQAASDSGHETVVQLLLEKGANVNAKGGQYGTALQAASDSGHEAVVRLLLNQGANVNAIGGQYGSALQAASDSGHESVVKLLLEKGADVNARGGQYGFALQAASHSGHESVVRLLLEKGADINAEGGVSGNALQAAAVNGHEDVVQLLLESGAKFQNEMD